MPTSYVLALAILLGALLVCLEFFWLRGSRERLERSQRLEWERTQDSIRHILNDPSRVVSIENAKIRAISHKAYLAQLCESTANALRAPAAVITVVEHEGQRWLAYFGADWCGEDQRSGLLEPLENSYCQYVVHTDNTLVISDSHRDSRVKYGSKKTLDAIRAYLGAPVHTVEGHVIGSLCVFDSKPRHWSDRDRTTVESFAGLVRL